MAHYPFADGMANVTDLWFTHSEQLVRDTCYYLGMPEKADEMVELLTDRTNVTKERAARTKRKKDPHAPKRNKSSYMFFSAAVYDEVSKAHPTLKITERSSKIGAMWAALDAETKDTYQQQATADKQRYAEELVTYREKLGEAALCGTVSGPGTMVGSSSGASSSSAY